MNTHLGESSPQDSRSVPLRILVADDHELLRMGTRFILEKRPCWKVVGEAGNGREAVEKARQLKPDVVIMDITMPEINGLEATGLSIKAVPRTSVRILTFHDSAEMMGEF